MTYYLSVYSKFAQKNGVVWGAYGPRIFGSSPSQYDIIIDILRRKPNSRQAVIQLFDKKDIKKKYKDVPCTCTIQFLQRDGFLDMVVHMRSNDAYLGLPHDIFSFTSIQEIVANELGYKIGRYKHLVGSLHLYDRHRDGAAQFLSEGLQRTQSMPAMAVGSQMGDIEKVKVFEEEIRIRGIDGIPSDVSLSSLSPFWADMVRLLGIFSLTKGIQGPEPDRLRRVIDIQNQLSDPYYKTYIRRRSRKIEPVEQLVLINSTEDEESQER